MTTSNEMKILSIDYDSVNSTGGVSTFNRNLKSIFNNEIDFLTLYKANNNFNIIEQNLKFERSFSNRFVNYLSSYKFFPFILSRFLFELKPNVIIINSPSLARYIDSELYDKLILVQHHDFETMRKNKSNFANNTSYMIDIFKKIDYFVALSNNDAEYVIRSIPDEFHHKVVPINHMSNISVKYDKDKQRGRSLVMLGRLDLNQKRHDLAIHAMCKLPEWSLSIYGDGKDKDKIHKIISKAKVDNVFIHGATSSAERVLREHDIHIMTSDFEGYGLTNIEAMSCGLPLILRNTFTAAKDIIYKNGILLSPEWSEEEFVDAVRTIDQDYSSFSFQSIQYAKRYSPEKIKQKWYDLIYG